MAGKDTATLSAKFQISIPKAIRAARCWQAGQVFAFIPKGEGMLLVPVPKLEELSGLARGAKRKGYRDRSDRIRCASSTRRPGSNGSAIRTSIASVSTRFCIRTGSLP
jgi:bifunctional DNA-binding transcriptional regulator/antitoxin component of YhaV-PrlF toxin-antitoxin module